MNAALLYRPRGRWTFWIAFACAAAIHVGAVGLANSRSEKTIVQDFRPPGSDVDLVDVGLPDRVAGCVPRRVADEHDLLGRRVALDLVGAVGDHVLLDRPARAPFAHGVADPSVAVDDVLLEHHQRFGGDRGVAVLSEDVQS